MTMLGNGSTPDPAPPSPVGEHRLQFHHDLYTLEQHMSYMATLARQALQCSLTALAKSDDIAGWSVIDGDDDIDRRYVEIERQAVDVLGRQQPVASDLRFLVALLHAALHIERIGDMAVDIAEAARSAAPLTPSPEILDRLGQMGEAATAMIDLAIDAFTRRDPGLCQQLPGLDDRIDTLHREMVGHVLDCRDNPDRLEWALRMLSVSRALERAADHAVDIGEQAWYLITGELRELDSCRTSRTDQTRRPYLTGSEPANGCRTDATSAPTPSPTSSSTRS